MSTLSRNYLEIESFDTEMFDTEFVTEMSFGKGTMSPQTDRTLVVMLLSQFQSLDGVKIRGPRDRSC